MDLKQLRQVLVLAETLNFRQAAAELSMAQPPLSVSIRKLEEELGVKFFDRTTREVKLTAAGRSVMEHARRTLFHAEQFRIAAQLAGKGQAGRIRLDFVASSTVRLLPRALARFRMLYPHVDLQLVESNTDIIMRSLRDGRIDAGIVRFPTSNIPDVVVTMLDESRLVAALPSQHALARRAKLRLHDLRSESFIFPPQLEGSGLYAASWMACQDAGFLPQIVQQASHAQTIISLVEAGMGVALVPDVWARLAPREVVFKQLADLTRTDIGLAFACRADEADSVLIKNLYACLQAATEPSTARSK